LNTTSRPPQHRGSLAGHGAVIASNAIYTVGLICQKKLAGDISIMVIAFWQFFGAALLLWTATLIIDGWKNFSKSGSLLALIWGFLAPGSVLIVNMYGSRLTDRVSMTLIWGLLPFVAPILAPFVLGEELRKDVLLGAAIAFVGVVLGATFRYSEGWTSLPGLLLCGLAVLLAGLGFVLGRLINREGGNWRRSAALQMTGAASLSFVFLLDDGFAIPPMENHSQIMLMSYLILMMSFVNFLLLNFALSGVPVAFVSLYAALMPAFGAVASWLFLADTLRLIDYAMITLVVLGVALPGVLQIQAARRGDQDGAGV
jgi:drug/metabolite transporter (DMT)-like permease